MKAIPITERLPEPNTPQGDAFVLAYETGEHPGWAAAVYHPERGWQYDTSAISGYEWEVADMGGVTHWMPYPPAPEANCYIVEGEGAWLGAYAVVFALDEATARQDVIALFREQGLMKTATPTDLKVREVPKEGAHLVWNGDY